MPRPRRTAAPPRPENYQHAEATQLLRPEVGTQPLFQKRKEPATYRYDSSLSPALDWDTNPAREQGEALIAEILSHAAALERADSRSVLDCGSPVPLSHGTTAPTESARGLAHSKSSRPDGGAVQSLAALTAAAQKLNQLSRPFLNWTGKAERLSFDVPTLPLFVHVRPGHAGHPDGRPAQDDAVEPDL